MIAAFEPGNRPEEQNSAYELLRPLFLFSTPLAIVYHVQERNLT